MDRTPLAEPPQDEWDDDGGLSLSDLLGALRANLALVLLAPLAAGAIGFGLASLMKPVFTASTTVLPPQQASGGAASALAALGSMAALAGANVPRGSADQFVALMQSTAVSDRIIDRFKLMQVYEADFRMEARKELRTRVRFTLGKKDGLVSIEVDDTDPQRAADMANRYIDELRAMSGKIAITEAQQRRMFFERLLVDSRDQLTRAQQSLQASGFDAGALKADPRAAAESYARLKAELTAGEIRLANLRSSLADGTPEVQQQLALLQALQVQVRRAEAATAPAAAVAAAPGQKKPDYVTLYRDFKYQETLFEMYARQFELARVDEGREGGLFQVIDVATPPEKKSKPRRSLYALGAAALGVVLALVIALKRRTKASPAT